MTLVAAGCGRGTGAKAYVRRLRGSSGAPATSAQLRGLIERLCLRMPTSGGLWRANRFVVFLVSLDLSPPEGYLRCSGVQNAPLVFDALPLKPSLLLCLPVPFVFDSQAACPSRQEDAQGPGPAPFLHVEADRGHVLGPAGVSGAGFEPRTRDCGCGGRAEEAEPGGGPRRPGQEARVGA
eukprot:scaffold501_cov355-Pinguiococcus_pyrenoidosus.AAC.9